MGFSSHHITFAKFKMIYDYLYQFLNFLIYELVKVIGKYIIMFQLEPTVDSLIIVSLIVCRPSDSSRTSDSTSNCCHRETSFLRIRIYVSVPI